MPEERRKAARLALPETVRATVADVPVGILELSTIGARIEHHQRFPLQGPVLRLQWNRSEVLLPFRAMRSQIVARREADLIYHSGIEFVNLDREKQGVIASILQWAAQSAVRIEPAKPAPPATMDDTWTRQIQFLRTDPEDLPYMQFRLGEHGWMRELVASPEQPDDGFTIPRNEAGFEELQKTFEIADPATRQMMRIALQSKLTRG